MARHFSRIRFRKLIKNLLLGITAISIFVAIFSQVYSGVYKIYEAKVKYCDEEYKDEYMYVKRECYNPEQKIYRIWLDVQDKSPKVAVATVVIDIVILGLYGYLFPKSKKNISD